MYDISDSVPLAWDVKDSAGALTNATTVTLTITLPDGTTTSPSVTNPSTGHYQVTYVPAVEGRYAWRAVMTGPNAAYQDVFDVRETVSPSLVSLADAKSYLNITSTTTDDELRLFLEAVTRKVEEYVGPIVRRTHTARVNGYTDRITLPHTQVTAVTAVTLVSDGSIPVTLSDLAVDSKAGVVSYKNGGTIAYGDLDITYTVGRSYVEPNWILAAEEIAKHNWQSQLGNLPSIQGDNPGYSQTGAGYLVPYRAQALLQPDDMPIGFA